MRQVLILIFTSILMFCTQACLMGQNQWSFYLAFEDASGQRDTIWRVLHQNASIAEIEPELGEIPFILSPDSFNVWQYILNLEDHYKVNASLFTSAADIYVYANNFQLPITVTWDPELFSADVFIQEFGTGINGAIMDNTYFPPDAGFNMIGEDHVILPYFEIQGAPGDHFPLFVGLSIDPSTISVRNTDPIQIMPYPNPSENELYLQTSARITSIDVYDVRGKLMANQQVDSGSANHKVDVSAFPAGMYFIHTQGSTGYGMARFVKQ